MNSRERFLATVERRPVDRPASWIGLPDPKSVKGICEHFKAKDIDEVKAILGDDVSVVELPYHSPVSDAIYAAFDFTGSGVDVSERTLTAKGCFSGCEDPAEVDRFDWPQPEKYISPAECFDKVASQPTDKAVLGVIWSAHFQDTCAAFGMEDAFVAMLTDPEVYKAIDDRIVDFYLRANGIFYEATKGRLDAVLIGNDMGSQTALMLSPELIREFVLPGARKLIAQAKSYGLKVIYHSCGAISDIIPDLIDAGADVIHPIQALAAGMDAESLCERFGGKVSFCGGVDTQELLVNGTSEEVKARVRRLCELFPTGLVISPSHEAILPDVSPANIGAIFDALK